MARRMQYSFPTRDPILSIVSSALVELGVASAITAIIVALLSGYVLSSSQFPLGDGLYVYEVFYSIFTQLNKTGEIARWFPYSSFGMTADLRHFVLPFLSFPVMEIANALGAKNAWHTFLLVVAINYWLTSIGLYLLLRQFVTRPAASLATAALLWTIVIDNNIYFSLYTFITTPFTLLFLVLCAKRQNLTYLSIAVVLAGLGAFLPTLYFTPYHALAYTVVGLSLAIVYRPQFSFPFRDFSFWAWTIAAVAVLTTVGYLAFSSLQNLQFFTPDRDQNLHNSLQTFLYYGGGPVGVVKSLEPFIGVPLFGPNPLFFLTSIGVIFPLYAVWANWNRDVAVLLFLFWFFLFLCWGPYTPLATIAYHFPGMNLFRHIGYTFAFPKLFAIALTAIGLQKFFDQLDGAAYAADEAMRRLKLISLILTVFSVGAAVWYVLVYQTQTPHSYYEPSLNVWIVLLLVTSVAWIPLTGYVCRTTPVHRLLPALAALVLVQAAIYQVVQTYTVFHIPMELPKSVLETTPQPFEEQRTVDIPSHPRGGIYDQVAGAISSYSEVFSFLQLDACFTRRSRTDYTMSGVAELARRQLGNDKPIANLPDHFESSPENAFFPLSGCKVAKLQWVPAPDAAAETKLPEGQNWPDDCAKSKLCLEGSRGNRLLLAWPDGRPPAAPSLEAQGIKVEQFHFNDATFSLTVDQPGWLIYADAYDPRWSVEIDGAPAENWQANFAYKAVHLDRGRHSVTWRFGRGELRPIIFMGYQLLAMVLIIALVLKAAALGGVPPRTAPVFKPVSAII
jgi:hypothetical protein